MKVRTYDVHVRLSQEEKTLLLQAAAREQRKLANYLRVHGLAAARSASGPTENKEQTA